MAGRNTPRNQSDLDAAIDHWLDRDPQNLGQAAGMKEPPAQTASGTPDVASGTPDVASGTVGVAPAPTGARKR